MKTLSAILFIVVLFISSCDTEHTTSGVISTETLLEELISLERLSYLPDNHYKTVQFSSYDRRSTVPGRPGWFKNSDGFGGEPVPGFLETIIEPDSSGIGEYLVCDIRGPGAIVRTWTAMINGELKVYLDNKSEPLYSANAEKFLWNTAWALSNDLDSSYLESVFRQNDACYFPLPFSNGCRIVWRGDISKLHFYQIQVRLYSDKTDIRTFSKADIGNAADLIEKIAGIFNDPSRYTAAGNETRRLASLGSCRMRASGRHAAGGGPQDAARAVWRRHGARVGCHRCSILRGGDGVIPNAAVGHKAINPHLLWPWLSKNFVGGTRPGKGPTEVFFAKWGFLLNILGLEMSMYVKGGLFLSRGSRESHCWVRWPAGDLAGAGIEPGGYQDAQETRRLR